MEEIVICPVDDCKLTVDVVLKSSDGDLLGAHQHNLEMFTEAFPIAGSAVASCPVSLEETAEVLRLMLRYTHNTRLRSLDGISFSLLASLAEAVEKYMIYSAMEFCKIRMTLAIDDHPDEVFLYSTKHHYPDLADKAAKLTLRNPVWDFLSLIKETGLPEDVSFRWFRYREGWMGVFRVVVSDLTSESEEQCPKIGKRQCSTWSHSHRDIIKDIMEDVSVLGCFNDIVEKRFERYGCSMCRQRIDLLAEKVKLLVKALPTYSKA